MAGNWLFFGHSFRFLGLLFREILILILPGGGFLANIYTPWMGYYRGLRFVPRSFPPGIAFRRFSFRLSKVADFLSISFAREKLFPGKNFFGQCCGNFFFQNFFLQLSANIFSAKKLFPGNFEPKTFPGKNFFKNNFLQIKKTFLIFSKYFFTKIKPL